MPHKTPKRRKGDIGEAIALKYLINRGYSVLERNYLRPWGELDLVATFHKKLHFVEVKTVSRGKRDVSTGLGQDEIRPEENMHEKKMKRLSRAIHTYLLERKVSEKVEWQIDLVCIYLDFSTKRAKVEMFENVIL